MNDTMQSPDDSTIPGDDTHGRCELLGSFALFVQGALGALALLVLLWKRAREHPQRPLLIWFMDVSKQVIGGCLVHAANLLLSMISSGSFTTDPSPQTSFDVVSVVRLALRQLDDESPLPPPSSTDGAGPPGDPDNYHSNPCSFYLLNLGIDTTLGVIILIYTLRMLQLIIEKFSIPGLRTGMVSGYYGDPPKWRYWVKQSSVYFAGLMIMKAIVAIIFALFPWLGMVGDFLLSWTEGNKQVQVFFVMFFFPLVMNAFQYYVIDSYIKDKDPLHTHLVRDLESTDDEADPHARQSFNFTEDGSDSEGEDGPKGLLYTSRGSSTTTSRKRESASPRLEEYDPNYDGVSELRGSPESGGYFRNGRPAKKPPTLASRNSSMMLLPGSRGPSTPGYPDEELSIGRGSGVSKRSFGDESTLVERDGDR